MTIQNRRRPTAGAVGLVAMVLLGMGCQQDAETVRALWRMRASESFVRIQQLEGRREQLAARLRTLDAESSARWRVDVTLKSSAQSLLDVRRTIQDADARVERSLRHDLAEAKGVVTEETARADGDLKTIDAELASAANALTGAAAGN